MDFLPGDPRGNPPDSKVPEDLPPGGAAAAMGCDLQAVKMLLSLPLERQRAIVTSVRLRKNVRNPSAAVVNMCRTEACSGLKHLHGQKSGTIWQKSGKIRQMYFGESGKTGKTRQNHQAVGQKSGKIR